MKPNKTLARLPNPNCQAPIETMPVAMTKAKEAGGSCATDILEIEDNLDAIAKQDSLSAHSIRALAVLALIWINKPGNEAWRQARRMRQIRALPRSSPAPAIVAVNDAIHARPAKSLEQKAYCRRIDPP